MRAIVGLKLAEIHLFPGQDDLLLTLDSDGILSISELGSALDVRPSTVSKMVDRLLVKRFVNSDPHVADRRRSMISITPDGREAATKVRVIRQAIDAELVRALSKRSSTLTAADLVTLGDVIAERLHRIR